MPYKIRKDAEEIQRKCREIEYLSEGIREISEEYPEMDMVGALSSSIRTMTAKISSMSNGVKNHHIRERKQESSITCDEEGVFRIR